MTLSMFRERREMDGLRGDKGEAVLVAVGAGLATTDGILIAMHQDNGRPWISVPSHRLSSIWTTSTQFGEEPDQPKMVPSSQLELLLN